MGKTTDNGNDEVDDADTGLWAYVIRTVMPIKRDVYRDETTQRSGPQPIRKAKRRPLPAGRGDEFSNVLQNPSPSPMNAAPPVGLDRRTEERLRRGQMDIEAVLDLHGMTVAQAQPRLQQFLIASQAQGLRCVLVITGKGGRMGDRNNGEDPLPKPGILRQSLPQWLGEAPLAGIVLQHFPAKGRHGGSGAFYILLRRIR